MSAIGVNDIEDETHKGPPGLPESSATRPNPLNFSVYKSAMFTKLYIAFMALLLATSITANPTPRPADGYPTF